MDEAGSLETIGARCTPLSIPDWIVAGCNMIKEERIVSVATFHVTPTNFDLVLEKVTTMVQRRPTIPGLVDASVLTNQHTTCLLLVSTWQSTHSWAAAQWDDAVQHTIADVFEDTASYDLEVFSLLVRA